MDSKCRHQSFRQHRGRVVVRILFAVDGVGVEHHYVLSGFLQS
jgi:hypothetical protein